jgi:cytoskeletal protein RodZ
MKRLKSLNSHKVIQGKNFLGLMLISGVLGIGLFGCNQETTTPEAAKPTGTVKSVPATTTAKPSPTTATVKSVPATTTAKPSPTTATPKPSPATPVSQANQSTQSELPKPNSKGDYSRTSYKFWQIVDTSGKGVSCRMGKSTFEEIQTPGNSVVLDIGSWPVIGSFKQGQSFEVNLGPAGFGTLSDTKKEPWIFVEKTADQGAPTKCFVRANSSSVKPIQPK